MLLEEIPLVLPVFFVLNFLYFFCLQADVVLSTCVSLEHLYRGFSKINLERKAVVKFEWQVQLLWASLHSFNITWPKMQHSWDRIYITPSIVVCYLSFSKVNSESQGALSHSRLRHDHHKCPPKPSALGQCGPPSPKTGRQESSTQLKVRTTSHPWEQLESKQFPTEVTIIYSNIKRLVLGIRSWRCVHEKTLSNQDPVWSSSDCFRSLPP